MNLDVLVTLATIYGRYVQTLVRRSDRPEYPCEFNGVKAVVYFGIDALNDELAGSPLLWSRWEVAPLCFARAPLDKETPIGVLYAQYRAFPDADRRDVLLRVRAESCLGGL